MKRSDPTAAKGKGMNGQESTPIEVKQLRKSFGRQTVLDGVSLHVASGETLAVLGRSGTGKSVLLKIIVGLQAPDSGSVSIYGREITGMPLDKLNEIRKKIGFLFQQAALYASLTVEENIIFPLQRHTDMTPAQQKQCARELLKSVGMEKDLHKMPGEISGGMQKRVGLARALALDPDIILFDEPTAGLDPITTGEIQELILKLHEEREIASIVVTHDVRGAETVAGRVVMMREGKIIAQGAFKDLQHSDDKFVSEFLEKG